MVGAKGTAPSLSRSAVPREFSDARYFLSLAAAVLVLPPLLLLDSLLLLLLELVLLPVLPLLLEPSFFVEL